MYVEDASYTQIPHPMGRYLARQWRFLLERRYGLYNVVTSHRCSDVCFGELGREVDDHPILESDSVLKTKRKRWDENRYNAQEVANQQHGRFIREDKDDVKTGAVEVISSEHFLFGCTRSGQIHVCHQNIDARKRYCKYQFQNLNGAIICRFSGLEIEPNEHSYNKFTDDTFEIDYTPSDHYHYNKMYNSKAERERRSVAGEGKETADKAAERNTLQHLQTKSEKQHHNVQSRNQIAFMKRRQTAVVPSLNMTDQMASPFKPLTQSDAKILRHQQQQQQQQPPPPKPPPLSMNMPHRKLKHNELALPGGYIVRKDVTSKIHRFIKSLIANAAAHQFTKHTAQALDPKMVISDRQFTRFYARRISLVYCLINEQGKLDKQLLNKQRKKKGQTACITVNIRELTITMLYIFACGYNEKGISIINNDERLKKLLPVPANLPYYDLKPDVLREIGENDPHIDKSTIFSMSSYTESMYNVASDKLQRIVLAAEEGDNSAVGRDRLIELLNTNYVDFEKVAPSSPNDD